MAKMRRKDIRLPSVIYENPAHIFSLTICTWQRNPWFKQSAYADALIATLHKGLFADKAALFAYCLMPDHLHLLVSPTDENLPDLITRWKSFTANQLRKMGLTQKCWQKSFYDHALRKEEDIKTVVEYTINNPVRAGMVSHWSEYAWSWHRWM